MKQSEIRIIPMEEIHVPQIAAMEQAYFTDAWSENCVRSELINPLSLWLVAMNAQTVVGYIGSQTVLGEADIMNVAVAEDHRRQGIARQLLNELQRRLAADGAYSLTLEVRVSNEAAIRLYHSLGYVQVGRRPNYYHKPKEDALILRKEWQN